MPRNMLNNTDCLILALSNLQSAVGSFGEGYIYIYFCTQPYGGRQAQTKTKQLQSYVHFVSFKQRNNASSCMNVGTAALNYGHKWVGTRARLRRLATIHTVQLFPAYHSLSIHCHHTPGSNHHATYRVRSSHQRASSSNRSEESIMALAISFFLAEGMLNG